MTSRATPRRTILPGEGGVGRTKITSMGDERSVEVARNRPGDLSFHTTVPGDTRVISPSADDRMMNVRDTCDEQTRGFVRAPANTHPVSCNSRRFTVLLRVHGAHGTLSRRGGPHVFKSRTWPSLSKLSNGTTLWGNCPQLRRGLYQATSFLPPVTFCSS